MNKKKILIAGIAVLLFAVLLAVIIINVNKGKVKLFTDSNYPCMYKSRDNNVVFQLNDKNNYDIPWQIEEDGGIVDASVKNDGKGRKAVYTLSAKAPGMTELRLYKTKELLGFEVEIVSVRIPVNISENETGMVLNVFGSPTLTDNGGAVGGRNTDNPYILLNNGDGTAKVVFVKGQNDWTVSDSSNMASIEWNIADDSYDLCQISENPDYDPDAEVTTEITTEYIEPENSGDEEDMIDPESVTEDNSESSSSKGSSEKPSKTAKDIGNMTISDEDYENGSIDLSEYAVDGEIPEDVLKALDEKLAEKAKEMGDDSGYSSDSESDSELSDTEDGEASEDGLTINPETGVVIINEEDLMNMRAEKITVVKETILTVSSEQYNTVEYIKVSFMSDGNIMLSISKKGPKK